MELNVFKRFEKKFLLTDKQVDLIIPIIETHMDKDPNCVGNKGYFVRNLYYDTLDSHLIRTSLTKPEFKEKIRIRKYGFYGDGLKDVFLEIKRKVLGVAIKRRVKMSEEEAVNLFSKNEIPIRKDFYSTQILKEIKYFISIYPLQPTIFISYQRLSFIDKTDATFRLTIDTDITTRRDQLKLDSGDFGEKLLKPGMKLMEVKVGDSMPLWFANALSQYKIYMTSYSKYGKEYENKIKKELLTDV